MEKERKAKCFMDRLSHFEKLPFLEFHDRDLHTFHETLEEIIVFLLRLEGEYDMGESVRIDMSAHLVDIYAHQEEYLGKVLQDADLIFENHFCLYMKSLYFHTLPICRNVPIEILLLKRGAIDLMDIHPVSRDIPYDLVEHSRFATMRETVGYMSFPSDNELGYGSLLFYLGGFFLFFHLFPDFLHPLEFLEFMEFRTAILENAFRYR